MLKPLLTALLALLLFSTVSGYWCTIEEGFENKTVSFAAGSLNLPSFEFDSENNPGVAYLDSIGEGDWAVRFGYWNGSEWKDLGTVGEIYDDVEVDPPSLVFFEEGGQERPLVVYSDQGEGICAKTWGETGWEEMPEDGQEGCKNVVSDEKVKEPDVSVSADGTKIGVAWIGTIGPKTYKSTYYKYWDAASGQWTPLGDSLVSSSEKTSYLPKLGYDSTNYPRLAWAEGSVAEEQSIHYVYWNGSEWKPKPDDGDNEIWHIAPASTKGFLLSFGLDSNDKPYIVWRQKASGDGHIIKESEGTENSWTNYEEQGLQINESALESLLDKDRTAMCICPNGKVYTAWTNGDNENTVFFKTQTGGEWGEEEQFSTQELPGDALLQCDSSGRPCIVWSEGIPGSQEVYFLCESEEPCPFTDALSVDSVVVRDSQGGTVGTESTVNVNADVTNHTDEDKTVDIILKIMDSTTNQEKHSSTKPSFLLPAQQTTQIPFDPVDLSSAIADIERDYYAFRVMVPALAGEENTSNNHAEERVYLGQQRTVNAAESSPVLVMGIVLVVAGILARKKRLSLKAKVK